MLQQKYDCLQHFFYSLRAKSSTFAADFKSKVVKTTH